MEIIKTFKVLPDGSSRLLELLSVFNKLKKEQIIMFFLQIDPTFNRDRIENLLDEIKNLGEIEEDDNTIFLKSSRANSKLYQDEIRAFWVLLHFLNKDTKFEQGRYPANIIFQNDDTISEIIVCKGDMITKMDYVSKRIERKNKTKLYFLETKDTIESLDDELFPDEPFSIITVTSVNAKGIPSMVFHNVSE